MNTFFDVLLKLLLEFCYIITLQDRVSAAGDCITVKIYISLFSLNHITTFLDLDFLCQMSRFFLRSMISGNRLLALWILDHHC